MKKLLAFLLIAALPFASHAQTGIAYTFPLVAGDTLNNTDTVFKFIPITAGYSVSGIQVNTTRISGTLAGAAYLYTAVDSKNYHVTDTASYVAYVAPSVAIPTATSGCTFRKSTPEVAGIWVVVVSTGTYSGVVQVAYTVRKYTIPK